MRCLVLTLFSILVGAAQAQVLISQVYPGGSTNGVYLNDYVELLNTGQTTYSLTGHSLQYGTASGNLGSTAANIYAFPSGSQIGGRRYLLIQTGAAGSGGVPVPSPDQTTGILEMGPSGGKLALVNITASLNAGAPATPLALPDSRVLDLVAYGNSNNAEGGAAASLGIALTANQALVRKNSGLQDTNSNVNDFDKVTAGGADAPRNSTSPPVVGAAVEEWQLY
jgi:hypothetical protein